jgi:hypothetical protein
MRFFEFYHMVVRVSMVIRKLIHLFRNSASGTGQYGVLGWKFMALSLALPVITDGVGTCRLDAVSIICFSLYNTRKNFNNDTLAPLIEVFFRAAIPLLTDFHRSHEDESLHRESIAPIFTAGDARPLAAAILSVDANRHLFPMIQNCPPPVIPATSETYGEALKMRFSIPTNSHLKWNSSWRYLAC